MKIAKKIFINRPMCLQYFLSLILEIPIIICFITNIPQVLWQWYITIGYTVISLTYYITNRGDWNYFFISVSDQSSKEYTLKFWKSVLNSLLTITKYIFMGILFQTMLESLFGEYIIAVKVISIYSLTFLVAMCLILWKILFILTRTPPVYTLLYIAIPLFTFSLIGIEKSILSWTFASLILISLLPQFFNEDIELLQTNKFTTIVNDKVDNESKGKLIRLRYQVLLFIPFLYLALIISERLIYTDQFNFLFNYLFLKHENILTFSYFSLLNIIVTVCKILVVLYILIVFFEFKDNIADKLSKFVLTKVLKKEIKACLCGKYNKVFFSDKKWQFDESDYYSCIGNSFHSANKDIYTYERGIIKTKDDSKNIKIVSKDILIIDETYYVESTSDIYKTLSQEKKLKKLNGYSLLKRPDYFVFLFPFCLAVIFIFGSIVANNVMTNHFRGEYVFANVKEDRIESVDESKKIQFKNNKILSSKEIYKVNNVTMQILNSNSEVVGAYNKQGIIVFKDDNQNVSYYILKSSELFKTIPNE